MPDAPLIVCGIDAASRTVGFCALAVRGLRREVAVIEEIRLHGQALEDRLAHLLQELDERLTKLKPYAVAVEAGMVHNRRDEPWEAGRLASALMVAEARGVAKAIARHRCSRVHAVQPASWRSAIGLSGKLRKRQQIKPEVQRLVALHLGMDFQPRENAADAGAIAIWMANRLGTPLLERGLERGGDTLCDSSSTRDSGSTRNS